MTTMTPTPKKSASLLESDHIYKPFRYPWAFEAWRLQQQIHWLPDEVPLADDVRDWNKKLTEGEKNLLTQVFRFFTQSDVEVNNCYMKHYAQVFKPTEIQMMLAAFANTETIHIAAYAHLLDTIGMPETEYSAFLDYKEMKDKYEFLQSCASGDKTQIARTLAVFGAFTEGLQLFASFAILLNFPRHNKMKGMGQVISWSVRDETLHTQSIIRLFHTFCEENPEVLTPELKDELVAICDKIVRMEDAFIDLAFEHGDVEGLSAADIKEYVRAIANLRLEQLNLPTLYEVDPNPLPWLEAQLVGVEFTNFFENRATEYSRAATQGTWDEAFAATFSE